MSVEVSGSAHVVDIFCTKLQLLLWKATMIAAVVTVGLERLLLQKILQL
jgi:hypothetical protein